MQQLIRWNVETAIWATKCQRQNCATQTEKILAQKTMWKKYVKQCTNTRISWWHFGPLFFVLRALWAWSTLLILIFKGHNSSILKFGDQLNEPWTTWLDWGDAQWKDSISLFCQNWPFWHWISQYWNLGTSWMGWGPVEWAWDHLTGLGGYTMKR